MERFVFRLEQVMEFRRRAEENLLGEKAGLDREVGQKRDALTRLVTQQEEEQKGLRTLYAEPVDPDEIRRVRAYLDVLGGRRRSAEDELGLAEERRADCVRRLLEARKATRSLERLKERQWQEYRQRSFAELQRELDESGATRWLRENEDHSDGGQAVAGGRRSGAGDA